MAPRHERAAGHVAAAGLHQANEIFLQAAQQVGLPFNPDFNGTHQVGVGKYDLTISGGERSTSTRSYLDPVRHRPNLTGQYAVPGFQFDVNLMRPRSVGHVSLDPQDPFGAPMIDPRFLIEQADRDLAVSGVRFAREVMSQSAFDACRGPELSPGGDLKTDEELLQASAMSP